MMKYDEVDKSRGKSIPTIKVKVEPKLEKVIKEKKIKESKLKVIK